MALQSLMTAAAIAITLSCADPAPAQTPAEMFTRAKLLEHQDGDVKAAIATYAQIVVHQDAPPSMQAKALFRQALCHIKLEQPQLARESFARIEKRFPGTDEALQARLMRASLVPPEQPTQRRDLTFEVQQLLVAGTESSRAAQSALRSLHFLDAAAVPVLKQALTHSDTSVKLIAAHALAARGDGEVLDLLLSRAGTTGFNSRRSPTHLSYGRALRTLCDQRADLWTHVQVAYEKATGRRKSDLLRFFADAGRFDAITGYRALLESEDRHERDAAWSTFRREIGGKDDAKYVGRLLELWAAHPEWRLAMVTYLHHASSSAKRAGDAVYSEWLDAVCKSVAAEKEPIVEELVMNPSPIRLLAALAASRFPRVRNQAAQQARQLNPGAARIDQDSRSTPASPAELQTLAVSFLDAATLHAERDLSEASVHLAAVLQIAGLLPPAEYQALVDRVLEPRVLGRLLQVRRSQAQKQLEFTVYGLLGGSRQSNPSASYSFVDKYLPGLIRMTRLTEWAMLQKHALLELTRFANEDWTEIAPTARTALRDAAIAVEPSKNADVEKARQSLIKQLVVAPPPVFTVAELLTNLDGRFPSDKRLIELLAKRPRLKERYAAKELIAAVTANLANPKSRVADLYSAAHAAGLDRAARDALLHKLWTHPDSRARREVIERLVPNQANLAFLNERYDGQWTDRDRVEFVEWLEDVPGVLRVPPLLRLIGDVDDTRKIHICVQLSSLADRAAAPKLIELLSYRNHEVRNAAEAALGSIRAIQSKQDSWREWYEKSGGAVQPGPVGPGRKR